MEPLAETPSPPYYAVIFTSMRAPGDAGYGAMADRMMQLVRDQPGFLGVESVRDTGGVGITISYWDSLEHIRRGQQHAEHLEAQQRGRSEWYARFKLRVCRVERSSEFEAFH